MSAGATSATLAAATFGTPSGKQIITINGNDDALAADFLCTIAGTAITSMTLLNGSDVEHPAGAPVWMGMVDEHSGFIFDFIDDGWVDASKDETWVYASASTFTIASVDLTTKYAKGTKLRFKQGGGFKYATVALSAFATNTTVTIIVNTDYTIANAAITDIAYSYVDRPQGFPTWFSYTPATNITLGSGVLTGRYTVRGGNSILANVHFVFDGSTMASGSTFGAPVASASTVTIWTGMAYILDSGTKEYAWAARLPASSSSISFNGNDTAGGITTTVPMTWANPDELDCNIEYQF